MPAKKEQNDVKGFLGQVAYVQGIQSLPLSSNSEMHMNSNKKHLLWLLDVQGGHLVLCLDLSRVLMAVCIEVWTDIAFIYF